MRRSRLGLMAVTSCLGVAAIVLALMVTLRSPTRPQALMVSHTQPDLSVQRHIGPTLRELRANFAILRRPATAAEHAAVPTFTAPTNDQPEIPEYVRLAGRVGRTRVYFIVYPIFRHGARGPVVAHEMTVSGGPQGEMGGYPYIPGNYLIFPTAVGDPNSPTAYVGVVPDGVRSVRWQFACISGAKARLTGCQLPTPRVMYVPVHHNLAILQTNYLLSDSGAAYAGVTRVTWYGPAGMSKVFTNPNRAVPFPGAPPWRS